MTVAWLSRSMSEREFRAWQRYAATRCMPSRRIEAYMAQIASVIAQVNGNSDMSIADFILEFKPKKAQKMTAESGAHMLANIANVPGVRKLGQGRKK